MSKIFLNLITIFTLLLGGTLFSQSVPTSFRPAGNCFDCVPNASWTKGSGTPDVSNRTTAANTGAGGGGATWTNSPLPLPLNGHESWITIRDLGTAGAEESLYTSLTDLVSGREYEIFIYSLTTRATSYSPDYKNAFDFQIEGQSRVSVNPITRDAWGVNKLRFTASNAVRRLTFFPGRTNSAIPYQSVNISITLNAINSVPIAVADNTYTTQGVPVTINVTSNDSDPGGAIVVSTVDLDPSTPGIQNFMNTAQGSWSVNNLGVVTFDPAVGFSGIATLPYTIQDDFMLDGENAPSTSNPANINVTVQQAFSPCIPTMFLTQFPANGGTTLYTLDNANSPMVITAVASASPATIKLNGIGYNPVDNFIYGINTVDNHLFRTDANANHVDLGPVSGLPAGTYISGDIDDLGNYYVKENSGANGGNSLYNINIAARTASLITLTNPLTTADFAYSKIDGLLYGVNQNAGVNDNKLYRINPVTGVVLFSTGGSTVGSAFGAMYSDGVTGAIYGNSNTDATFYQFNKTTGRATRVSASISAVGNDGAHCVNAPIKFGVDLSVTKTDGKLEYIPGTTNTYTVVVSNAGPFTALNATVQDLVPTGIPAANVSYTAVASAGSDTSVVGTQTGAINDVVNIQSGGNITYTIVLTVPADFTGSLVNTATVTASDDNTDTDLTNNSATDTDTLGSCYNTAAGGVGAPTNHGITLLKRAGSQDANQWPMSRKSAHTVLESNTKGFVITRMTTLQINNIVSPQEGMMVFDTDLKCLKVNTTGTVGGWSCFNTPACP